ncbi:MAG TPA: hypothetical protein VFB72_14635 [Verrucomicrobiae bacterium]|nr:hypothetical protein [Verrucomicrobiae bacterium]
MKVDSILQEIEDVKDLFSEQAGTLEQFSRDLKEWMAEHPHPGPSVSSAEELQARMRHREATEKPLPETGPYRVHDPIIAEIHRTRKQLSREQTEAAYELREEPRKKK